MQKLNKCAHCGAAACIFHGGSGLFYARCTKCTKYGPYDFLGRTADAATEQWNAFNGEARAKYRAKMSDMSADRSKYVYEVAGQRVRSLAAAGKEIGVSGEMIRLAFGNAEVKEGSITYRTIRITRFLRENNKEKGVKNGNYEN